MRISESRVRQIIEEEFRTLREADAHEEDLIHQAYHSGRSGSSGPEPVTDDPVTDEPRDPDDEPFVTDDETPDEPPDADAEKEHVRKSLMRRFNDSKIVDFGLDILGTVGGYLAAGATAGSAGLGGPPAYVIAALPDLLNCVRNAARGDSFSAAIYFLCALPIIGEVLGPVKISIKLLGTAARAAEVFKIIDQIRKLVKGLKVIRTTRNVVRKIKEVCEKYFPDFDGDAVERDALIILNGSDDEVEDLLRRSGYLERERADDEVSTEAAPLSESKKDRYVSIILESSKSSGSKSSKSSNSKSSSKKQDPLPPIPSTVEFEREMRGIISAYHAGEDIEAWLTHDILGSKASPHGLSRKTGWSGDEDFYRKPAASYIAQHLATSRDPELRAIGQRVLRKMGERMGSRRFSSMGSGFGLEPIEDID